MGVAVLAEVVGWAEALRRAAATFLLVPCHIALVFGKGPGKDVAAVIVAHEIERVAARRVEGGTKRDFLPDWQSARVAGRRGR